MESVIIVVHILAAIGITGLVLIQHGKGADMGASFGSGSSQTMFGSLGAGNALTKSTTMLADIFFITSLGLAVIARDTANLGVVNSSLIGDIEQVSAELEVSAAAEDLPVIEAPADLGDDLPVVGEE